MAFNSAPEKHNSKQHLSNKSVITDPFSEVLPDGIIQQLKEVTKEDNDHSGISEIQMVSGSSNQVMCLLMDSGRSLIIKQAPFDWAGPRFRNARRASSLLQEKSPLVTPKHLQLPDHIGDTPMMAYWFISHPTLENVWPRLSGDQRVEALYSFGKMLRKMHEIKVDGYGTLNGDRHYNSVSSYMEDDLRNRLRSAVWFKWPEALPIIDRLGHMASFLPEEGKATLIHNDLHLDNILCRVKNEKAECIGLLDLEAAVGGAPESDLASATVLHDPLFAEGNPKQKWVSNFDRHLLEGYGNNINHFMLKFFQTYHLLNLGYFSALNGDTQHANRVAKVADKKLKSI